MNISSLSVRCIGDRKLCNGDPLQAVVKQTPMEKIKARKSTRGERLAEIVKTGEFIFVFLLIKAR